MAACSTALHRPRRYRLFGKGERISGGSAIGHGRNNFGVGKVEEACSIHGTRLYWGVHNRSNILNVLKGFDWPNGRLSRLTRLGSQPLRRPETVKSAYLRMPAA